MGPSPHLRFLQAKQRLFDQNCKSHGSHPSSVVLCMQNNAINIIITSLHRSQPSSVVFACKTATFDLKYKSLWVPDLTYGFLQAKQGE